MRLVAIASALLAVLFALLAVQGWREQQLAPTPAKIPVPIESARRAAPTGEPDPVAVAAASRAARAMRTAELLATSSLRGSDVDGGIVLDGRRIVPDRELRRLFDWWLSLEGELTPALIRRALADWLTDRYDAVAAQHVLDLFDRYAGLRAAAAGIDPALPLAARLGRLHAMREQWLGREAATAFFADDERAALAAIARREVAADTRLTRAEREARIADLDAELPEPERNARETELEPWLVEAQTRQLEASGATEAERRAQRSAIWGEQAAQRLSALDAERAAWDARVASYVSERESLAASTPPGQRDDALAELRARSFAAHEARRVESLEAIDALR